MFFLFQCKDDVTLDHVYHLFSLSFEFYVVSSRHATFNFNNDVLTLIDKSLPLAVFTVLCIHFAFSLARIAWLLHLHLHEAHIYHLYSHPLAFAFCTSFLLTTLSS